MAHLGSFAAALREVEPARAEWDDFDFCGEKFVVNGTIPAILMLQLAASTSGKVSESEGMAAMWQAFTHALGEKGFAKFYRLSLEHNVGVEDIMRVVFALFEAQDGRPTGEASASSPGPSTTSPSLSASSSHPALAHLRPVSEVLAG